MKRREFVAGLAGAAAWPLVARAQQPHPMRRIGVIMNAAQSDLEPRSHFEAFVQTLEEWGWVEGRNVRIDSRWGADNADSASRYASELVALAPDVIVAAGGPVMAATQRVSRAIPIVFSQAIDPVGAGFVDSLSRPGGNATGFIQFEYSLSGKWPELLKELAPAVIRIAILRDASNPAGIGQWAVIQAMAPSFGMELSPITVREAGEIERGIREFAAIPGGGLILPVSARGIHHRELIITLAARHGLPAVYPHRDFVTGGGLISYGPNLIDQYRRAAGYVDRILKGEKPSALPVLAPTKYNLVINLKTAKALNLAIPPSLLARADELIE